MSRHPEVSDCVTSVVAGTLPSTQTQIPATHAISYLNETPTNSYLTKAPGCTLLENTKKIELPGPENYHSDMDQSGRGCTLPGIGEFTNAYSSLSNTKVKHLDTIFKDINQVYPGAMCSQPNDKTNNDIQYIDSSVEDVTTGKVSHNLGSNQRELIEHSPNHSSSTANSVAPPIDTTSSSSNEQPSTKLGCIFTEMASSACISNVVNPISSNIHAPGNNVCSGVKHLLENTSRSETISSTASKVPDLSTSNSFGFSSSTSALHKRVLNSKTKVVMKDGAPQRKTVGICSPIAIREHNLASTNIPGIEYLLNTNPKTSSVATLVCYGQINPNQSGSNTSINGNNIYTNEIKGDSKDEMNSNKAKPADGSRSKTSLRVEPSISCPKTASIYAPITISNQVVSTVNAVNPGVEYIFHGTRKSGVIKDDRPFLCQTCGNKFRQQSHLQQHIRIHTNDRPYKCRFCEKAFKQRSQINQHERIHTGEKPYKCVMCEKAFAQAGQLVSHKKTHGLNIDQIRQQQRELREKQGYMKRGRRPKTMSKPYQTLQPRPSQGSGQRHQLQDGSTPSVIYIMESHPRIQLGTSYNQLPARSTAGTSTIHYAHVTNKNEVQNKTSERLPKIETVVSLSGPRLLTPNVLSPVSPHYLGIELPTTMTETHDHV